MSTHYNDIFNEPLYVNIAVFLKEKSVLMDSFDWSFIASDWWLIRSNDFFINKHKKKLDFLREILPHKN